MIWRILGIFLIALGFVVLGVNFFIVLQESTFTILSLGKLWSMFANASYSAAFGTDQDPDQIAGIGGFILGLPAFAPWFVFGLIALLLSPRRKRKSIFRQ